MKSPVKFLSLSFLMLSLLLVVSSCKDDDKKPKNQIKVDGKTFNFSKGYIVSEQIDDDGEILGSAHWVFLTGGDLEIEDNVEVSGNGDFLAMYIGSDDENDLVADEYDMRYGDYDFGNVIFFDLYQNYGFEDESEIYDAWYGGDEGGDVTISTSGDKHTFKIALDEYYFYGDSDDDETEDFVSENLKGYFNGELEVLTVDELPTRLAGKLRKPAAFK